MVGYVVKIVILKSQINHVLIANNILAGIYNHPCTFTRSTDIHALELARRYNIHALEIARRYNIQAHVYCKAPSLADSQSKLLAGCRQ